MERIEEYVHNNTHLPRIRFLQRQATNAEIAPIIIDLGKEKRKRIKDLKRGRGRLMNEVAGVINEARMNLGAEAEGKEFIPIILIYPKKRNEKEEAWPYLYPFLFSVAN
jgi:hypothetical protein